MLNHHFEVKQEAAQRRRYGLLITGLLIFLFTAVLLSFWVGYYPLSPSQVVTAFLSRFGYEGEILPQAVTIFWNIRLPRILSLSLSEPPCPQQALPIRECSAIL